MKKAFTLAEVLITLGVIGIVASMTLPTVITKYRKQATVAKLQKFYTTMNQALKRSEVDNGEYKYWPQVVFGGADEYFNKYWRPYLRILKVCNTLKACEYTEAYAFRHPSGEVIQFQVVSPTARTAFRLADGTTVINAVHTHVDGAAVDLKYIYVDLNGGKSPNVLGSDVFLFFREENGIIAPACHNYKTESQINAQCKSDGLGTCCAAKIMRDGWKIKDDYPVKI